MKPKPPEKEIAMLRKGRERIDPARVYTIILGDGEVRSYTGVDLIATADAFVALADAGDDPVKVAAALKRIDEL